MEDVKKSADSVRTKEKLGAFLKIETHHSNGFPKLRRSVVTINLITAAAHLTGPIAGYYAIKKINQRFGSRPLSKWALLGGSLLGFVFPGHAYFGVFVMSIL